ncbi:MAG: hypothetical protein OEW75_04700 [Cyclobacteriaceae bacterium]|nr:hypothetical protein [Cyclobacteriaceae bacterium]
MKRYLFFSFLLFCSIGSYSQHKLDFSLYGGKSVIQKKDVWETGQISFMYDGNTYTNSYCYEVGSTYSYGFKKYLKPYVGISFISLSTINNYIPPPSSPDPTNSWTYKFYYLGIPLGISSTIYKGLNVYVGYVNRIRLPIQGPLNQAFFEMDYQGTYSEHSLSLGASYSYKDFSLGFKYMKSLTPVKKSVLWKDLATDHYFRSFQVGLSYSVFSSKEKS